MNSLNAIMPFKRHGLWVFNDKAKKLEFEPFVCGADTMIDRVTATIPKAENGFWLLFSASGFPDAQFHLEWEQPGDGGGNWYTEKSLDMRCWLCPALLKYFDTAPKEIWVQVKARTCP